MNDETPTLEPPPASKPTFWRAVVAAALALAFAQIWYLEGKVDRLQQQLWVEVDTLQRNVTYDIDQLNAQVDYLRRQAAEEAAREEEHAYGLLRRNTPELFFQPPLARKETEL